MRCRANAHVRACKAQNLRAGYQEEHRYMSEHVMYPVIHVHNSYYGCNIHRFYDTLICR